jgi:hypothetical protein
MEKKRLGTWQAKLVVKAQRRWHITSRWDVNHREPCAGRSNNNTWEK